MIDLFPWCTPKNEAINDNTHPMLIRIHIEEIQKLGSTMAAIIPVKLQMIGTYQILFGFCLIIMKQQTAITKSDTV